MGACSFHKKESENQDGRCHTSSKMTNSDCLFLYWKMQSWSASLYVLSDQYTVQGCTGGDSLKSTGDCCQGKNTSIAQSENSRIFHQVSIVFFSFNPLVWIICIGLSIIQQHCNRVLWLTAGGGWKQFKTVCCTLQGCMLVRDLFGLLRRERSH